MKADDNDWDGNLHTKLYEKLLFRLTLRTIAFEEDAFL